MINKEKYFENGKLKRESIAMDIKYHRISHEDLLALIEDPDISREFYGDSYADKIPQVEWNEQYLDKLSYAVVSEAFNKDYLLYLEKVAKYVREKKSKLPHLGKIFKSSRPTDSDRTDKEQSGKVSKPKASSLIFRKLFHNSKQKSNNKPTEESTNDITDLKLRVYEAYDEGIITEADKDLMLEYLNLDNYEEVQESFMDYISR